MKRLIAAVVFLCLSICNAGAQGSLLVTTDVDDPPPDELYLGTPGTTIPIKFDSSHSFLLTGGLVFRNYVITRTKQLETHALNPTVVDSAVGEIIIPTNDFGAGDYLEPCANTKNVPVPDGWNQFKVWAITTVLQANPGVVFDNTSRYYDEQFFTIYGEA